MHDTVPELDDGQAVEFIVFVRYLDKLDGNGRFSDTSPAHDDDFVRLGHTAPISRLRHDVRSPTVHLSGEQVFAGPSTRRTDHVKRSQQMR